MKACDNLHTYMLYPILLTGEYTGWSMKSYWMLYP